jgi:cytochrome c oxidase assembly factor CtaG
MIVSPLPLATAVVASVLFARGFRRLRRRRPEYAGAGRAALFALAVVAGLVAVSAPFDELAERSLAAHMAQHLLLADVVPLLALLAVRGPLLLFVVPEFLLRAVAGTWVAHVLGAVTRPLPAFAIWLATLALWHVPAVYGAALSSPALHVVEHASFVLAGTIAWMQVVDPARRRALGTIGRLVFLLGMFTAGQMLTMALVLVQRPLYEDYAHGDHRLFGMSALADQDAAGLVMMAEQILVLGAAAAVLLRRHLAESDEASALEPPRSHPFAA